MKKNCTKSRYTFHRLLHLLLSPREECKEFSEERSLKRRVTANGGKSILDFFLHEFQLEALQNFR